MEHHLLFFCLTSQKSTTKDWEKYLQKTHLIKDCYPKYTKNSYKSTITKPTAPRKMGQRT